MLSGIRSIPNTNVQTSDSQTDLLDVWMIHTRHEKLSDLMKDSDLCILHDVYTD